MPYMNRRALVSLLGAAGFLFSAAAAVAENATERLSVPGPISFHGESFSLSWASHPYPHYYKQEYLPAGQDSEHYTAMVLLDANIEQSDVRAAAAATVDMLQKRKASDPLANFSEIENRKTGEIIVDFIMSSPDGGIVEWNAYRYAPWTGEGGKAGVVLFGISRRAYGDDATAFLAGLKAARPADIDALASAPMPAVVLKE
jgi:hypothetical protein